MFLYNHFYGWMALYVVTICLQHVPRNRLFLQIRNSHNFIYSNPVETSVWP